MHDGSTFPVLSRSGCRTPGWRGCRSRRWCSGRHGYSGPGSRSATGGWPGAGACGRARCAPAGVGESRLAMRRRRYLRKPRARPREPVSGPRSACGRRICKQFQRRCSPGSRDGGDCASSCPGCSWKKVSIASLVAGQDHHQIVALVLHHLQQDFRSLRPNRARSRAGRVVGLSMNSTPPIAFLSTLGLGAVWPMYCRQGHRA